MKDTVSIGIIILYAAAGIFSVAMPLALLIAAVKKLSAKVFPALIGAATFIIFAMVLEQFSHMFFIAGSGSVAQTVRSTPALYILYAGLAAGVFEECGRLFAYRFMLKKRLDDKTTSISYGIGHGGVEAVIVVGLGMLSGIILAVMINKNGAAALLASYPAEVQATLSQQINSILYMDWQSIVFGCFERISAVMLHISLSVFVYAAVVDKKKRYLFPLAILAHAGVDFFAVHYQLGIITSILLLEIVVFSCSLLLSYFALRIYRALPEKSAQAGEEMAE